MDSQETQILPNEIRSYSLAAGAVLRDRYRLDSELGRGGMGIVFRATDLELMREVAIKVLPASPSWSDARERLLREARAAAALNHPHIVAVHDIGDADGMPFFVMELVNGPSLSAARHLSLPRIVEIASQVCAALEHAHANSIVHRDLKPDNVLLSSPEETSSVKLADLGLALLTSAERVSRAGIILGTASYMAPEQALGQTVDGRADLYALGVLLYELTTGRLPFTGHDALEVVSQHVHAPVVPPRAIRSDLPRSIETLILRLLAKDPAARFQSAAEVREALRLSLTQPDGTTETGGAPAVAILDALSRGRMVGRASELAEARELWRRARDGHGHAVLLSGEPGAGKTRLAREMTIQAAVEGAVVLSGGCYEYEATTPYLPFVEAFRRWVREHDDDSLREILGDACPQIAKLAPEIETRLGPLPQRHELSPHEERLLFFDAVAQVFGNLARRQGLLFYADDLHWADRGTLWLLGHLLRQLRDARVLIVGAYRETELDRAHPLAKALVDWNRERLVTRIPLKRFNKTETTAQLGALLGEDVSADFGDAVHSETEGNPFFIEEVLKALIEKGSVRRESGRWQRCDVNELVIPQSVKEAIGNRLDRVSPECNDVLRTAAVLGKVFTFEELTATAQQGEEALLDALDEGVGAQLIAPAHGDSFTFTHDKIREVLYEELNPIRRRRLHRNAAEGLEQHRAKSPVAVEKLAHHYIQAGDHERGLDYAKQAAAEAERVFAFDEAVAAYGRARDCAEALGLVEEQLAQEEAIGKAYLLHGEMIPAGEHFERALALATDPATRARLQCQAASSLVATGDQRGIEYVREALRHLDPETNPLETANALSIEGRFHHLAGRHKKSIDLLLRAADLVAPTAEGDEVSSFAAPMISQVYAYNAGANQHYGRFADADVWARRAIEFGTRHNVPFAQAIGYEFLGEDAVHTGAYEAGLEYAALEREIAARLHSRERRAWTHVVVAQCSLFLGRLEEAEREYVEGIALADALGEKRVKELLKSNLAVAQAKLGRYDEALKTAEENYAEAAPTGLLYTHFEALRCLAVVRFRRASAGNAGLDKQELDEAERWCRAAEELIEPTESRVSRLWLGPLYIRVLLAQNKRAEAAEKLATYKELVADCQSPRFSQEADSLAKLV
ncbi:MAG: protein kinase [Pyrinomonadaceae bacterium]